MKDSIDFDYEVVYQTKDGYTLDEVNLGDSFQYTVSDDEFNYIDSFESDIDALDMKIGEFMASSIFKKFLKIVNKARYKKKKEPASKVPAMDTTWKPWTPTYKTSTEEALKKYCKSNTICFHRYDPTTTMLSQIYDGKGWDVVNDSNEMSPETIAELIDRHERVVMLGHGTPGGLIGFIDPGHAPHLEPKKLFALWCNADAYCDRFLPNKKGFFACGNMPSDDGEASWVGYHVSHKYMDDNITYWCKLCGDVVEQCLEGDADAGCQYIRDKYWERYHKGTADEVGITKYNYVRTKVAGQANLPEPTGEEIEGPKETIEQQRKQQQKNSKAIKPEVVDSKEKVIAETDKGYTIAEVKQGNGYQYLLLKNDNIVHVGNNPTKLTPEDVHSDFNSLLDIGNLI